MGRVKEKYYIKHIVIDSLKLDFDVMTTEQSKDQLDLFLNILFSRWYEKGDGEALKVYDFVGSIKAKKYEK